MSKKPQIVRFSNDDATTPKATLPVMLKEIESLAEAELERLLNTMLDSADDKLFDMADKSNEVYFFNAMRIVRIKRKGLVNTFKQEFSNNFSSHLLTNDFESEDDNIESLELDNITLVQKDDLEEDLALDAMTNKARSANATPLRHMATRLDTICTTVTVDGSNNPLDPRAICQAFKVSSKLLDLDIESLLVVYKLFDRFVMNQLEELYNDVNREFAEKGILPDLHKLKPRKKSTEYRRRHTDNIDSDESYGPAETGAELERSDIREEVFNTLQSLLSEKKVSYPQQQPSINTEQLVSALTNLQHDQGFASQDLNTPQQIKTVIGGLLPSTGGQVNGGTIGNVNDDVIDIITLLFDVMLEDRNLHPDIKAEISRLQIPMLKVGLVDRSFFSERSHPARQLLNELAKLGIGWNPSAAETRDPLLNKVTQVVERVINEFKSDIALFDQLLQELEQFKESDQRRASILEKRMREAEEGKARSESAKRTVNSEVARICHGRVIAEPVKHILKEAWTNVLFLEQLKPGGDESYNKALKVAEFLVWSVQPKSTEESRAKLKKVMSSLIKNLKVGMDKISFNPYRASQLLAELEDCHRAILSLPIPSESPEVEANEQYEPAELDAPVVHEKVTEQVLTELALPVESSDVSSDAADSGSNEASKLAEDDPVYGQIDGLQAGVWVELEQQDGTSLRCKLAAFIASVNKYIFVNRTGMKVAEFNRSSLADAMKQGVVSILDDVALFDRALESVITNLRAMKEA